MPDDAPLSTIDSSDFGRSIIFMLDRAQPAFPRSMCSGLVSGIG